MSAADEPFTSHRPAPATLPEREHELVDQLLFFVGKERDAAAGRDWTFSLSKAVRDQLVGRWIDTARRHHQNDVKRAYYLSMEYLPGRALANALLAVGGYDEWSAACDALGLDLDTLRATERAPALGNGGLGRLAACLMDSLASHDLPGYAYGIRYQYGMFAQRIRDGWQIEVPDDWLSGGYPWEFVRPEVTYPVRFGGHVEREGNRVRWRHAERIRAVAYDTLVPGYQTRTVLTLRLWSAQADDAFDLSAFNRGQYGRALADKNRSEDVCRVLYPDDSTDAGRELRLRQEYFFSSASLQDIVRRYLHPLIGGVRPIERLPDKVAVHLNDTHPAIAVAELMRLLVDENGVAWDAAWSTCQRVFSYTNHTLMPEALESWPVDLVGALLPRHLEIIFAINAEFLDWVRSRWPGDEALVQRVSLIDEGDGRRVRMAHLAVLASHQINGVSRLHSQLLVDHVFADFARLFPKRFTNVTNGVTPRRWLNQANFGLAELLDAHIDSGWRRDLRGLARLAPLAGDADFRAAFAQVKHANKQRLAAYIRHQTGIAVEPASMFDVQIKRIHEYKRQLLNILGVITRYERILAKPEADWVPRTVIFSGKAASSYEMAKRIIKLIHDVANRVNGDARIGDRLKVVFLPNYSVRDAEMIVPAADLSEQISTAGTEASGTGNMKLALNGALTIGTADGANIEIREHVGAEHIFIFGHDAEGIAALRNRHDDPSDYVDADPELRRVLHLIGSGAFSPDEPGRFRPIVDALLHHGDYYKLLADYRAYIDTQDRVDARFVDRDAWLFSAVTNVAGMGDFSSDRMARQYAEQIWRIAPVTHAGGEAPNGEAI